MTTTDSDFDSPGFVLAMLDWLEHREESPAAVD
jgi:hypothetical protein